MLYVLAGVPVIGSHLCDKGAALDAVGGVVKLFTVAGFWGMGAARRSSGAILRGLEEFFAALFSCLLMRSKGLWML
jgi:hypothetical protein